MDWHIHSFQYLQEGGKERDPKTDPGYLGPTCSSLSYHVKYFEEVPEHLIVFIPSYIITSKMVVYLRSQILSSPTSKRIYIQE